MPPPPKSWKRSSGPPSTKGISGERSGYHHGMTSLREYVAGQFPAHEIDEWDATNPDDLSLSEHTVVSFVVGTRDGLDLLNAFRQSAPRTRVAALAVRPSEPTVVPSDDEDRGGVVDVPGRRVAVLSLLGAIVVALVCTIAAWTITDSRMVAGIVGLFTAFIGAAVGAIIGGARFAGERATSQPHAPGQRITVVAAFLDDEQAAASLARSVESAAEYEVRIVNRDGGWHSPGV